MVLCQLLNFGQTPGLATGVTTFSALQLIQTALMRIAYLVAHVMVLIPVAALAQSDSAKVPSKKNAAHASQQQASSKVADAEVVPASDDVKLVSGEMMGGSAGPFLLESGPSVIGLQRPGWPAGHHGPPGVIPCDGACGVGGKCLPCNLKGFWWETTGNAVQADSRVIRQIELHPTGRYNEVIFDRSGVRVDVVIGSFLLQHGELTLLVDGLPQAKSESRSIQVEGRAITVTYRVGTMGPFVTSFSQQCSQLVLTDASGSSRVWTRYPPPNFGVPIGDRGFYALGRPGPQQYPFPWLPDGESSEVTGASVPVLTPQKDGEEVPVAGSSARPGMEVPSDQQSRLPAGGEPQSAEKTDLVGSAGFEQQKMAPAPASGESPQSSANYGGCECGGCECSQTSWDQWGGLVGLGNRSDHCGCNHSGSQMTFMEPCSCGCNTASRSGRPVCEAGPLCDRCLGDNSSRTSNRHFEGVVESMFMRAESPLVGVANQAGIRTRLTSWLPQRPNLAVTGDYLNGVGNLTSAGLGLRTDVCQPSVGRFDLLTGYRFLHLPGGLENRPPLQRFSESSQFHGGELGLLYQNQHGLLTSELLARTALGANIYQDSASRFAVVPELGAQLGLQLTRHLTMRTGYTLIYWSDAVSFPLTGKSETAYGLVQSLNVGLQANW